MLTSAYDATISVEMRFEHTVTSEKCVDEVVSGIESRAAANGFRVLHTHDVAQTLAEKGFYREPLKIIEVCNAQYASEVLKREVKIALMLPCPISVYTVEGTTRISTMLPTAIVEFFPNAGVEALATEVECTVLSIIKEAR